MEGKNFNTTLHEGDALREAERAVKQKEAEGVKTKFEMVDLVNSLGQSATVEDAKKIIDDKNRGKTEVKNGAILMVPVGGFNIKGVDYRLMLDKNSGKFHIL